MNPSGPAAEGNVSQESVRSGVARRGERNRSVDAVSVVVPTCGDAEHLPQAIDSLLKQTVEDVDLEIVVVDSSSTDVVRRLVEEYDERLRYEWTEPDGVAAARNRGIELATGGVIGFCDADDYWHPRKLEYQLPAIEAGADVVYADEYLVSPHGDLLTVRESPEVDDPDAHHVTYFRSGGVGSRSVLVRSACLRAERFDESLTMREDPHLWTRLFAEFRPARIDRPLTFKRRRTDSLTADREEAFRMELREIELLVERFPELASYRGERERRALTRYARALVAEEGRPAVARDVLARRLVAYRPTARSLFLFLVTLLPGRSDRVLNWGRSLRRKCPTVIRRQ